MTYAIARPRLATMKANNQLKFSVDSLRIALKNNRPVAKATGRSAKGKPGAKRKALGADSVSFCNISNIPRGVHELTITTLNKSVIN
jgi:hypothetical protein